MKSITLNLDKSVPYHLTTYTAISTSTWWMSVVLLRVRVR